MEQIEVEIKKERKLEEKGVDCARCGDADATRTVTIGEVGNSWGTDFEICDREICLNGAAEEYLESLQEMHLDHAKDGLA